MESSISPELYEFIRKPISHKDGNLYMTGMTLIIGNKNYSSWSLRPWFFMKHHSLNFTEKRIALLTKKTNSELSKYKSDFKVPVLDDNGLLVWDSMSILEYISETYLEHSGWPKDSRARVFARSMCHEMHSSFSNIRSEFPMNCRKQFTDIVPSLAAQSEIERIDYLWAQAKTNFGSNGPWLMGDYSIVDAMFAPIALRFHGYDITLSSLGTQYVNTILSASCIVEWVEAGRAELEIIDGDEL